MPELLQPVSNILLMSTTVTVKFSSIPPQDSKHERPWVFSPPVSIERGKFYLIHVMREPYPPEKLPAGFYDAPEAGKTPYIVDFKLLQISNPSSIPTWAFFFEALEGTPPLDFVPQKNFDYRKFEMKKVVMKRVERLSEGRQEG